MLLECLCSQMPLCGGYDHVNSRCDLCDRDGRGRGRDGRGYGHGHGRDYDCGYAFNPCHLNGLHNTLSFLSFFLEPVLN